MYRYDAQDFSIVRTRAQQFTQQVERRISGDITENELVNLNFKRLILLQPVQAGWSK